MCFVHSVCLHKQRLRFLPSFLSIFTIFGIKFVATVIQPRVTSPRQEDTPKFLARNARDPRISSNATFTASTQRGGWTGQHPSQPRSAWPLRKGPEKFVKSTQPPRNWTRSTLIERLKEAQESEQALSQVNVVRPLFKMAATTLNSSNNLSSYNNRSKTCWTSTLLMTGCCLRAS